MTQPRYQTLGHDSIQYHFFCEGKLFAFRIFRTDSLEHHSAWIFDGKLREVLSSAAPVIQSGKSHIDVSCPTVSLSADGRQGALAVRAGGADDGFTASFSVRSSYKWNYAAVEAGEDVEHQPNLDCVVTYRGRPLKGIGYHKRYYWHKPPRYWGYRFLHGVLEDGTTVIWTADAMFGTSKYDYFKVLDGATGKLIQSGPNDSAHKQNQMFGIIDGKRHEAFFTEQGVWDTILRSSTMDSHMRQRAGTFEYRVDGQARKGCALTEYCFGSLG